MIARFQKYVFAFVLLLVPFVSNAQCPMCRLTAEGSDYAESLNSGILYLLLFPILVFGGGGLLWYYNRKKFASNEWDESE